MMDDIEFPTTTGWIGLAFLAPKRKLSTTWQVKLQICFPLYDVLYRNEKRVSL
jgi:hypothetical protein